MQSRTALTRRGRRGRLRAVAPALVVSFLLHSTVLGAALVPWLARGPETPGKATIVLVDLPPATGTGEAATKPDEGVAAPDLAGRSEALASENAELSARLAAEQRRTAQLEAQHRQEIVALETARSHLGEQVAALAADRAALAADAAAQRRRSAELEEELAARREAEAAALAKMRDAHERLVAALQREIADKDVALEQAHQRLTVAIVDRVLFPSGQATLTPEGQPLIDKIAAALAAVPDRAVLVEGHTDNVPIGADLQARFPSNWELSTARATEVVKRLIEQSHVPAARLSAVGRSDTEPVASNDTEEGRRRNRRIEIIILPPGSPAAGDAPS
jgi:chemotaxis protein MotB